MNKTKLLADLIQEFVFDTTCIITSVKTKPFVTKAGAHKILIDLVCTMDIYGHKKERNIEYAIYQDDLECEFEYTLLSVLHFIADELSDYCVTDFILLQHDKEVI